MRTQEEILKRMQEAQKRDLLGFEWQEYARYLDLDHVKPFLKEDTTEWEMDDLSKIKEVIVDYLSFAWEKANNCRGISANRSIMHFVAWLWLDENPLSPWLDKWEDHYEFYGKPILEKISEAYGFDWKAVDDGRRSNEEY